MKNWSVIEVFTDVSVGSIWTMPPSTVTVVVSLPVVSFALSEELWSMTISLPVDTYVLKPGAVIVTE